MIASPGLILPKHTEIHGIICRVVIIMLRFFVIIMILFQLHAYCHQLHLAGQSFVTTTDAKGSVVHQISE